MTDSGAFQGFSGKLYLKNKKIVAFQDTLRADVISPLDLVTPPGDNRTDATWKLESTLKRIREAKDIAENAILASVQQGGRFMDLRQRSLDELMEIGIEYLALGSLVPFFNKNHDLSFVGPIVRAARQTVGDEHLPIHIYGAGDPLELPFFFALGANVFDSASYGHYAQGGWYMTPYGALTEERLSGPGRRRALSLCRFCESGPPMQDPAALASHNLWTILETIRELRRLGRGPALDRRLQEIITQHQRWFPESELERSWHET